MLVPGALVTIVAWTAFVSFAEAPGANDPPLLAHVFRYVFLALGVVVPISLVVMIWWWLGSRTATDEE